MMAWIIVIIFILVVFYEILILTNVLMFFDIKFNSYIRNNSYFVKLFYSFVAKWNTKFTTPIIIDEYIRGTMPPMVMSGEMMSRI